MIAAYLYIAIALWSDSFQRIASLFNADRRHVSTVFARLEAFCQKNMSELANQEVQNQLVQSQELTNQEVTNQDVSNQEVTNQEVTNKGVMDHEVQNQEVKLETSIDLR